MKQGASAQDAFNRKLRDWTDLKGDSRREDFHPLPVELFGGWHELAIPIINRMAVREAHAQGLEVSPCVNRLFQRLSVALFKGIAGAIDSRRALTVSDVDFEGAPMVQVAAPAHATQPGRRCV